jgi:hypothetical protein
MAIEIEPIGGNVVYTFLASETFTLDSTTDVEYIIVGGGGGGGPDGGGGGGAGGVIVGSATLAAGSYPIVVGAGGIGGTGNGTPGTSGEASSAFGISALGGGRGSSWSRNIGESGGSGGGNGAQDGTVSKYSGTTGQGNSGGGGGTGSAFGSGGGGGAGGVGGSGVGNVPGEGGIGIQNSYRTGSAVYYGGGGGGGGRTIYPSGTSAGGLGGGGAGNTIGAGLNGEDNTGGGGGGGAEDNFSGGNGGSGIVIIRHVDPSYVLPIIGFNKTGNDLTIVLSSLGGETPGASQPNGTLVPYTISGNYITEDRIGNPLTGNFVLTDNTDQITINVVNVPSTTLVVTAFGETASYEIVFPATMLENIIDVPVTFDLAYYKTIPTQAVINGIPVSMSDSEWISNGAVGNYNTKPIPKPDLQEVVPYRFTTVSGGGRMNTFTIRPLGAEIINETWY